MLDEILLQLSVGAGGVCGGGLDTEAEVGIRGQVAGGETDGLQALKLPCPMPSRPRFPWT